MNQSTNRSIHELLADRDLIQAALNRAAREALQRHARDGQPIAVWRDGKVVWVPAEELLAKFPEDAPSANGAAPPNGQPEAGTKE